jgi:hypothetical protein
VDEGPGPSHQSVDFVGYDPQIEKRPVFLDHQDACKGFEEGFTGFPKHLPDDCVVSRRDELQKQGRMAE